MHFKSLAIEDPIDLIFGVAPKPLKTRSGMVIGGGTVYPELNFTLPPMTIDASSMAEVRRNYEQIIDSIHSRLLKLPDETKVVSGHGPASSIGAERRTNPFLT